MSIYISGIVVVVAAASSCYCLIQCKKQFFQISNYCVFLIFFANSLLHYLQLQSKYKIISERMVLVLFVSKSTFYI